MKTVHGKRISIKTTSSKIALFSLMFIIAVIVFYPIFWAFINSFKAQLELAMNPIGFPSQWLLQNYADAWITANVGQFFVNSVYIAIPTVIIILAASTLAGFAFAHLEFRGKDFLYLLFISGLAIPLELIIVSLFFQIRDMNLLNTYWSVILPQIALILPFGILLMRSFILDIPKTMIEAAKIDGCSDWKTLWYIVVPCILPALSSLLVFSFMWTWNNLFLPTVMLTDSSMRTIPTGLTYFQGQFSTNVAILAAAAIIVSLPVIILYIIFQRQFIEGITVGAMKE